MSHNSLYTVPGQAYSNRSSDIQSHHSSKYVGGNGYGSYGSVSLSGQRIPVIPQKIIYIGQPFVSSSQQLPGPSNLPVISQSPFSSLQQLPPQNIQVQQIQVVPQRNVFYQQQVTSPQSPQNRVLFKATNSVFTSNTYTLPTSSVMINKNNLSSNIANRGENLNFLQNQQSQERILQQLSPEHLSDTSIKQPRNKKEQNVIHAEQESALKNEAKEVKDEVDEIHKTLTDFMVSQKEEQQIRDQEQERRYQEQQIRDQEQEIRDQEQEKRYQEQEKRYLEQKKQNEDQQKQNEEQKKLNDEIRSFMKVMLNRQQQQN